MIGNNSTIGRNRSNVFYLLFEACEIIIPEKANRAIFLIVLKEKYSECE